MARKFFRKFQTFFFFLTTIAGALSLAQCNTQSPLFSSISTSLSSPIALAVDTTKLRAYVVNSNNRYSFTNTTLSVLDITHPTAPTLLSNTSNPIPIPNYSSQIYYDGASGFAYVPNRLTTDPVATTDSLLRIDLNESLTTFAKVDSFTTGLNPFGITCCDTSGRIYTVASSGNLHVYSPSNLNTSTQISLSVTLPSGQFIGTNSTEAVLLGTQAFVTNENGLIYVINTSEVGDTTKNPIDYVITNGGFLKGIATNGTLLYAVDGTRDAAVLRVINPATLTPVSPDTSTISEIDISTIQSRTIGLGNDPNEIVIFGGKAYITNRGDNTVSVIDLSTNEVIRNIGVGEEPFGMAAFTVGTTSYLYVTNLASNSISIIDLGSNTVVSTFAP